MTPAGQIGKIRENRTRQGQILTAIGLRILGSVCIFGKKFHVQCLVVSCGGILEFTGKKEGDLWGGDEATGARGC